MASTVSVTFQGRLSSTYLNIAYIAADQLIQTFQIDRNSSMPISVDVAKDTMIYMAGYAASSATFGFPIVRDPNTGKDLDPVFTKSAGSSYYICYAAIASEDAVYAVMN